jgi:hypothetical protein
MLKSGFDQLTLDSTPRLERARRRLKERDWFAIAREDIETALNEATAEVGGQIPKP